MSENIPKNKVAEKYLCDAYPMIFVTDIAKTVDYYQNKLGFKADFFYGDPPFYGMMTRDGASLHFRHVDQNPVDRGEDDLLATSISVRGVEALSGIHAEGSRIPSAAEDSAVGNDGLHRQGP